MISIANGAIEEVRIYSYSITPAYILSYYESFTHPQSQFDLKTEIQKDGIILSWKTADNGGSTITAYHVYRSNSSIGDMELIATLLNTEYLDNETVNDTKYYYAVSAENFFDEGPKSNTIMVEIVTSTKPATESSSQASLFGLELVQFLPILLIITTVKKRKEYSEKK